MIPRHPASQTAPVTRGGQFTAHVARGHRTRVRSRAAGSVALLEADPDLARHLDSSTAPGDVRDVCRVRSVAAGCWRPAGEPAVVSAGIGLFVLDGLLTRQVRLGDRRSVELLGSGDLLRPGQPDGDEYAIVSHEATWQVLWPARFAAIDSAAVARLAELEGVIGELTGRALQRSRSLAVRLAIAQLPRLEGRLHVLFWHLADRWGRRERGTVALPLPLSRELLAELICAKRTSVGPALQRLAERGLVARRPTGVWELRGDPPGELLARFEDSPLS